MQQLPTSTYPKTHYSTVTLCTYSVHYPHCLVSNYSNSKLNLAQPSTLRATARTTSKSRESRKPLTATETSDMFTSNTKKLPIIVLPAEQILLPGVTKRISLSDRPDVLSLLRTTFGKSTDDFLLNSNTIIGAVPLNPPKPVQFFSDSKEQKNEENGGGNVAGNGERDEKPLSTKVVTAVVTTDPSRATPDDLFAYGVASRIIGLEESSVGGITILVEGLSRFKLREITQESPFIEAVVETLPEDEKMLDHTGLKYFAMLKSLSRELLILLRMSALTLRTGIGLPPLLSRRLEQFISSKETSEANNLANFLVSAIDSKYEDQIAMLTIPTLNGRLEKAVEIIGREVTEVKQQLKSASRAIIRRDTNRDAVRQFPRLRQMPGLGDNNEDQGEDDVAELSRRVEAAQLSPEASTVVQREMKRLKRMSPAQAEYQVCRTYIENILDVPWIVMTDDKLDGNMLDRARKQLNDDHYGLEKIKRRLLEYLAVLRLKRQRNEESETHKPESQKVEPIASQRFVDKSPILLLVGPPGTGKTSLAKSVASALGRKFQRISLGGVRDEAEIRGHRRTYVAAMPGVIVSSLKKAGVCNPVILLDEIDKLGGSSFHGDPSAAMLEVLDPEQNWSFTDHYLGINLDLSKVLFIATANSLDTIPAPLLDRMETIHLSGYTSLEKKHIAAQYLIPKQLQSNGLRIGQVEFPDEVILKIVTSYTREAGVRNLEREIGSVCRAKAVEFAEAKDAGKMHTYRSELDVNELERLLGIEKYEEEITERMSRPGVVTGLVAFSGSAQGSILFIEMSEMPGSGKLQLTGNLQKVIKESVEVALTWVKSHAFLLGLTSEPSEDLMKAKDIHVHCPAGAVPKDGPSAGCAMTICLISLFSGRTVRNDLAITGEMSLRGKITAVGGIREKSIGALRAGVRTVLLPAGNNKDVQELPEEVKNNMEVIPISNIWEALRSVWPDWIIGDENIAFESRL